MRAAIEATVLLDAQQAGIARYTRALIEEFSRLPQADTLEVIQLYRSSRRSRRDRLPEGPRLSRQMWRGSIWPLRRDYDVVHATSYRLPPWGGPAKVATFHDLVALDGINFPDRRDREKQVEIYADLARRAEILLFPSQFLRAQFLAHFGGDSSRLVVTPLGIGDDMHRADAGAVAAANRRHGLDRPYLLFLGVSYPSKNLPRLLEAYARAPQRRDFLLAVGGNVPASQKPLLDELVARLQLGQSVRWLGHVAASETPALYSGASALLMPSLTESFGLPIVEAMACGTPVLTSNITGCPEVAGGHATLVDPKSVDDIAEGIGRALDTAREKLAAGIEHARGMTWTRTARLTLAAYESAAGI